MHLKAVLTLIAFLFISLTKTAPSDGNYFLKAAKNVPRIGRSSSNKNTNIDEMGKFFMKASKSVPRIGRNFDYEKRDQLPIWNDIADRFEYEPEFFTSPEVLEQLQMGDDPSVYGFEQGRTKRAGHKEHPKFQYMK